MLGFIAFANTLSEEIFVILFTTGDTLEDTYMNPNMCAIASVLQISQN